MFLKHTLSTPRVYSVSGEVLVYTHIHTYTLQKFTANVLSRFQSLLMKDDYVRFFRSLELFFAAVLQFFSLHNHLCSYTCHQHAVQKHFPVNLPVSVFHGFFFFLSIASYWSFVSYYIFFLLSFWKYRHLSSWLSVLGLVLTSLTGSLPDTVCSVDQCRSHCWRILFSSVLCSMERSSTTSLWCHRNVRDV